MANRIPRVPVREQDPKVRATNFEEVCYGYNKEEALLEASRCLNCKNPRCMTACPVNLQIPRFIAELAAGNIAAAAARTGGRPESAGEIIRCVYDSLALCVRDELRVLEALRGRRYPALHIVGGGIQAQLLMQLVADACGIPVLAGPVEATAIASGGKPSSCEAISQLSRAAASPCAPVQALAMPLLMTTARSFPPLDRSSRQYLTGAAAKRHVVNTPAASAPVSL